MRSPGPPRSPTSIRDPLGFYTRRRWPSSRCASPGRGGVCLRGDNTGDSWLPGPPEMVWVVQSLRPDRTSGARPPGDSRSGGCCWLLLAPCRIGRSTWPCKDRLTLSVRPPLDTEGRLRSAPTGERLSVWHGAGHRSVVGGPIHRPASFMEHRGQSPRHRRGSVPPRGGTLPSPRPRRSAFAVFRFSFSLPGHVELLPLRPNLRADCRSKGKCSRPRRYASAGSLGARWGRERTSRDAIRCVTTQGVERTQSVVAQGFSADSVVRQGEGDSRCISLENC